MLVPLPGPWRRESPPCSWVWPLSGDEPHCCSHHDSAVITAMELRTSGTRAPRCRRFPPAPLHPSGAAAPNACLPLPQGRSLLLPRETRRRARGRRRLHTNTIPPRRRARFPPKGKVEPCAPPPGRRGARPETGGGLEAVPRLPRWSGPGPGERRGRGVK